MPRTPLYERLDAEGRVRHDIMAGDNTRAKTNVLPKSMSYNQMIAGYKDLYRRLFSDRGIAQRIRNKTCYLGRPAVRGRRYPLGVQLRLLGRAMVHGIRPGGLNRWWQFATTLWCPPRLWPLVVTDWVRGLSMRHYADHHFGPSTARAWNGITRTVAYLHKRLGGTDAGLAAEISQIDHTPSLIVSR